LNISLGATAQSVCVDPRQTIFKFSYIQWRTSRIHSRTAIVH